MESGISRLRPGSIRLTGTGSVMIFLKMQVRSV